MSSGRAELHHKPLNSSEGDFGPHQTLETSLLKMVFGQPRISAAAGPRVTNVPEPKKAQESLNAEFASKSASSEHRHFYRSMDPLQ